MQQNGRAVRRHDIDFIRVAVFALVMIFHASLIFGTRGWLVQTDAPSHGFDLIPLVSHPWRISLLFLISGIATAALARRSSPAAIRGLRSRQLIPPLLFGIFVLVPPQIYIAMVNGPGLEMSYVDFWATYLRFGSVVAGDGRVTSLVSLQHMWYIAYLWIYTCLLTLCLMGAGERLSALAARLPALLGGHGLFVWPIACLLTLRLVVYPIFGETMDLRYDWYNHIVYFGFFAFGYGIAENEAFWSGVVARRAEAAWIAGLSLSLIVGLFLLYPPGDRGLAVTILHRIGRSAFQWSAIVAILGFCRVAITAPIPLITYLNSGLLTYYVLHQTVMLVLAQWLKTTSGLNSGSFPLVVVGTMACCLLLYELQRQAAKLVKGRALGWMRRAEAESR